MPATTTEPASHNYWAHVPRAHALQQEKPPQWEAHALHRTAMKSSPLSLQLEKASTQQPRPNAAKNK